MSELSKKFERDIIKTYRKELWSKFIKAIKKYKLIEEGDRIAVAMSGGKDSLLLAKLFQELKRHPLMNFELEFISMNPGYNEINLQLHKENALKLGIPFDIQDSNIFNIIDHMNMKSPCYMCARMRRGFLYNMAKEKRCNKLALGHHFDDVIETTLMNVFYSGTFRTMLPKLPSENFEGLELIRPMYLIREHDIKRIMKANNVVTMDCGCEMNTNPSSTKRQQIKQLIKTLSLDTEDVDKNIFRSAENVDLDGIVSYLENGIRYERYEDD